MDYHNHTNLLSTISPSLLPANHVMPIPPPLPNMSKMLPLLTTQPSKQERKRSWVGVTLGWVQCIWPKIGLRMEPALPRRRWQVRFSQLPPRKRLVWFCLFSLAERPGTIPPTPAEEDAGTIPQTRKLAGTTPEKPTYPKLKGTTMPNQPATPCRECSSCVNDTKDEEYVSCFLEWHSLDPDCKRMLNNETNMLAHQERNVGGKSIPIWQ